MLLRRSLAFIAALASATALAQSNYPERPIRLIVPFPAGDGIDVQARLIGQRLTERWGQQVLVDNRPGAGTLIGTEAATKAPGDGYTILLVTTTYAINPGLHPKVPYDPIKDFAPLIQTTAIPLIVIATPALPANSLAEVLTMARAKPSSVTVGNSGVGTAAHVGMELLQGMAGVQFVHVPYRGIPPAMIDLLAGQLQLLITSPAQVIGHVRDGKVKPIVVTGAKRMAQLPNVPTVQEAGVAGFEANAWIGLVVPAATPREIVVKLNREIATILQTPDLRTRLENDGSAVVANTPEQFGTHIRGELDKWAKVIKSAGIKPQ